jgi:hypothetical protein
MTAKTCPDAATLFRLRAGQLPDPLASELRDHLTSCPSCSRGATGVAPGGPRLRPAHGAGAPAVAPHRSAREANGVGELLHPPEHPGELGRLGHYRVLRILGQDGMGYIFEAEHTIHQVRVALQVAPANGPGAERAKQKLMQRASADDAYELGEDNDAVFLATGLPDATPAPAETPVPARTPRYCPRCLADLKEIGGKEWCAKCGYSSDDEQLRPAPAEPRGPLVPFWVWMLVFGLAAIVAATCFRREFLPAGSTARVWWILIELAAGAVLYLVGHVFVVVVTFRQWRDGEVFKYIDPLTMAKYALEYLPRTRWGVCLAVWGVAAFLCGFVLFWMNDFALKDRKEKRRVVVGQTTVLTAGEEATTGVEPDVIEFIPGGVAAADDPSSRDVNLIDPYGTADLPDRQEPPNTTTCVVIGYVPDPDDPGRVAQLVLGTRGEDGTIRYAGTVGNFARAGEVDQGLTQVRGLRPLLDRPGYLPADLTVIPVEPSMTARIGYKERDAQGLFKSATVKGVSAPAPGP